MVFAFEIVVQDDFPILAQKYEVDARSLELGIEKQLRVGHDNCAGRSFGAVCRIRLRKAPKICTEALSLRLGVDFTRIIQATAQYLKNL